MENLSYNEFLALNRVIGEIHSARDLEMLYQSLFTSVQSIVPCEHCSINDIGFHPTRFLKSIASSQEHNNVISKL